MKQQIKHSIKAYLIRGAFYLLLLIAICAIPFALAQRGAAKLSVAEPAFQSYAAADQVRLLNGAFSPTLSSWTIVANYPLFIESPAVTSDATYAYSGTGNAAGDPTHPISAFYRYDPVANTWTSLPNVPIAVDLTRAVYASNTNSIYIFGGFDGAFVQNTTQIYDIATNTWSAGAPMPDVRAYPNLAYYPDNGKIYVIGGFDIDFNETGQTWEYDPVANTWDTTRSSIPEPMAGSSTSIVGQYIYLAGSYNSYGG